MFIKILREAGYEEALLGLSLSFYDHAIPLVDFDNLGRLPEASSNLEGCRMWDTKGYFWTDEKFLKAEKIALHLATKLPPENYEVRNNAAYISAEQKFLEQIDVWIYIQASRDFWQEMDTYRVDASKQSSSTMHTLAKREVTALDFEEGTSEEIINSFNKVLLEYKDTLSPNYHNVSRLKKNLPEGYLQERILKTSYKTLKWILAQREGHRLDSWEKFYRKILKQVEHPEFLKN